MPAAGVAEMSSWAPQDNGLAPRCLHTVHVCFQPWFDRPPTPSPMAAFRTIRPLRYDFPAARLCHRHGRGRISHLPTEGAAAGVPLPGPVPHMSLLFRLPTPCAVATACRWLWLCLCLGLGLGTGCGSDEPGEKPTQESSRPAAPMAPTTTGTAWWTATTATAALSPPASRPLRRPAGSRPIAGIG